MKEKQEESGCGNDECRFHDEDTETHYTIADAFGQEILLLCIVILTIIFLWKYLKRMFTIVFLILLGPISCITYPIDKISDGKAQAFNKWLTEFIYNVLIQPFHLLLYLVLVGSATKIASENLIYALACLGMLIPAEKFVKEMFGFKDKLGSPLGAMATGAIGSQMLSKMKGGGSGKSGGGDETTPSRLPKNKISETDLPGNGEQPQLDSGDSSLQTIEDSPTEYDPDDTGNAGGVSAASAYQDSSNPIRDAEREALEEKIANGEVDKEEPKVEEPTTEQPRMQEPETEEPTTEQPRTQDPTTEQPAIEQPKRDIKSKPKGVVGKLVDRHSTRMAKKHNSTSRGQRWINRGKKAARLTTKIGAGIVGGAIGLVSGKGLAGVVGGAVAGSALADAAIDKVDNTLGNTIRDYADALKTPEQRENKAFNEFRANHKQQDKARLNFIDKHDGVEPSSKELDDEMRDRFALSRAGLSDSQIDDAVGEYQKLKSSGNFTEKEALAQSVFAARYADMYKGKFSKTSDMKEALAGLTRRLEDNGYQGNAELKATEILQQAADMKKEDFALKLPGQTITLGTPTQTTTRQQVDIDVQEGAVNVRTNRNSHNTREINARINFRENPNNNKISAEKDNNEPEVKIGKVDTGRVQSQISSTRTRRQSANKDGKAGKKDIDQERLTNIKAQEAIDNNLDIKAGKKSVEEKGKRQLGSAENKDI